MQVDACAAAHTGHSLGYPEVDAGIGPGAYLQAGLIVEEEVDGGRFERHVAHLGGGVHQAHGHGHLCVNRHAERADAEADVGRGSCRGLEDEAAVVEVELEFVVLAVIVADAGEVALDAHEGRGEAGDVVEEVIIGRLAGVDGVHARLKLVVEILVVAYLVKGRHDLSAGQEVLLHAGADDEVVAVALYVHREGQHGRQLEVELVEGLARVLHIYAIGCSVVIDFGQVRAVEIQGDSAGLVSGSQVEVVVVQCGQAGQRLRAVLQRELGVVLYPVGQVEVEQAVVLREGEVGGGDVLHLGLQLYRAVGGGQRQVGRACVRHHAGDVYILRAVPALGSELTVIDVLCHSGAFGGLGVADRLVLVPHQEVVGAEAGVHVFAVLIFSVAPRCLKRQALQLVFVLLQHNGLAARLALVPRVVRVIVPQIHRGERGLIAVSHRLYELCKLCGIGLNRIETQVAVEGH